MVVLNRIYTRTGDDGTTALGTGARRKKYDLRVAAYGTVDEVNAVIGLVRLHTRGRCRARWRARPHPERPVRRRGRPVSRRKGPGRRAAHRHGCPGGLARGRNRPPQCGAAAAEILHPARRQPGVRLSASRPHGLPARRAHHGRTQGPARARVSRSLRSNTSTAYRIICSSPAAMPTTRARGTCCGRPGKIVRLNQWHDRSTKKTDNRERDHGATTQTDIGSDGFAGRIARLDGPGGKSAR